MKDYLIYPTELQSLLKTIQKYKRNYKLHVLSTVDTGDVKQAFSADLGDGKDRGGPTKNNDQRLCEIGTGYNLDHKVKKEKITY